MPRKFSLIVLGLAIKDAVSQLMATREEVERMYRLRELG